MTKFKKYFTVIIIFTIVFILGFSSWETKAGLIFQETRQWQIAATDLLV